MSPAPPKEAFRTHSNYIAAMATCIRTTFGDPSDRFLQTYPHVVSGLAAAIRGTTAFAKLQVRPGVDVARVTSSLHSAWGTELLLEMSGTFEADEMLALSNNWAVTWCYYIAYHATQAMHVATGQARPETHPATQTLFGEHWLRGSSPLVPWSLGVGPAGVVNLPSGCALDASVNSWSPCNDDNCWSLLAKVLRTTRDDVLRTRCREKRERLKGDNKRAWQREEQTRTAAGRRARKSPEFPLPRLTATQKVAVDRGMRPATVIDYLWRLRIRSNYVDADMFTEGPEFPSASRRVHRDLRLVASATLLLYETHLSEILGRKRFQKVVDDWISANPPPRPTMGVAGRRHVLFV